MIKKQEYEIDQILDVPERAAINQIEYLIDAKPDQSRFGDCVPQVVSQIKQHKENIFCIFLE